MKLVFWALPLRWSEDNTILIVYTGFQTLYVKLKILLLDFCEHQ